VKNQEKADVVTETSSEVYGDGLNSVTEQMVASSVESIRLAEVELAPKFFISPIDVRNAVKVLHLLEQPKRI
jgi:hypothetical protein